MAKKCLHENTLPSENGDGSEDCIDCGAALPQEPSPESLDISVAEDVDLKDVFGAPNDE